MLLTLVGHVFSWDWIAISVPPLLFPSPSPSFILFCFPLRQGFSSGIQVGPKLILKLTQAVLELMTVFLPQPPKYWCEPPNSTWVVDSLVLSAASQSAQVLVFSWITLCLFCRGRFLELEDCFSGFTPFTIVPLVLVFTVCLDFYFCNSPVQWDSEFFCLPLQCRLSPGQCQIGSDLPTSFSHPSWELWSTILLFSHLWDIYISTYTHIFVERGGILGDDHNKPLCFFLIFSEFLG